MRYFSPSWLAQPTDCPSPLPVSKICLKNTTNFNLSTTRGNLRRLTPHPIQFMLNIGLQWQL